MATTTSRPTPAEIKRRIVDLLNAIRTRQQAFSFRLVSARLREHDMPTARGYDELLPKYKALSLNNPRLPEFAKVLSGLYGDALFFSKRAVAFYEVNETQARQIPAAFKALVDADNPFSESYPFPVVPSILRRASYAGKFVQAIVNEKVVRVIACAKRSYRERDPILVDELAEGARDALSGYDEIIGIKHGVVQAFDYMEYDRTSRILSVHIDICCAMGQDDFKKARMYYVKRVNEACGVEDGPETSIVVPKNLFPYVQRFYDAPDGKVGRLGHATGTDSVKAERMRTRRKDLRVEPFHKKGLEEIKTTDSFSIRKSWQADDGQNHPTIELPGHATDAGDPNAAIYYAIFDQCANEKEYKMLVGKLA